MRQSQLFFSFLLLTDVLFGQSPVTPHAWLSTDNIAVRITPTGVHADSVGGFVLNNTGPQPINLLSHLTPWIAGIDPAGNLQMACEMNDPLLSDWKPGFRGIPNAEKVWKVTKAQIAAHLADLQDNGMIDEPISEIFSWPGRGNPFSLIYNGFEVPNESWVTAHFWDSDENGFYNPENGDYPIIAKRGNIFGLDMDQLVCSSFFNDTTGALSLGKSVHTNASLQAFTFDCNGIEFLENAAFIVYSFQFLGDSRMDSTFFGIYADFNIGNPSDDYVGSTLPTSDIVYSYNADTLSDAIAGLNPSMLGMNLFNGPLDSNGNEVRLKKVMPIIADSLFYGTSEPTHFQEFYNYISGSWRDGRPLTYGGTGFNGIVPTDIAYPDHPADANGWSELSSDNPPGDRRVIASYEHISLLPGFGNQIVFSLTASKVSGLTAQLDQLRAFKALENILIYHYDWLDDTIINLCQTPIKSTEPKATKGISISPNPASTHLTLRSSESNIREVAVFDFLGKKIMTRKVSALERQELILETNTLPPGLYTLQWLLADGRRGAGKLVVAR